MKIMAVKFDASGCCEEVGRSAVVPAARIRLLDTVGLEGVPSGYRSIGS